MSNPAELRSEFFQRLRPVRRRLRARRALAAVEHTMPLAAGVGIGLCVLRLTAGLPPAWVIAVAALVPLVVAAVWGLTRHIDWTATARAVDQQYALADRTLSALANLEQFDRDSYLSPMAEFQLRDALGLLEPTHARAVVKLRMSGRNSALAVMLTLALLVNAVLSPEKLANVDPANAKQVDRIADTPPPAIPSPFAGLPAEMLTQPTRVGQSAGPLATEEHGQESYLGDNSAAERYFELMDRKSTPPQRTR